MVGKVIRSFNSVARVIRSARLKKGLSQGELSHQLGYKNGQLCSNIERAICSLPIKSVNKAALLLDIHPELIVQAMAQDYEATVRANMGGE